MIRFFDISGYGAKLDQTQYADVISNTKISLCPRGNFAETFRVYESARAGSVIITDPLEKEWYFKNHPFIELTDWRLVGNIIAELLDNYDRLERVSAQSRSWWRDVACATAVGRFISQIISNKVAR
jgi:hypothetical protein